MKNKEFIIDARRSSIYFFSVMFLMMLLVVLILLFPDFSYWEYTRYGYLYLLIPMAFVKVMLPNSRLAQWLAKRVIIYKIQ